MQEPAFRKNVPALKLRRRGNLLPAAGLRLVRAGGVIERAWERPFGFARRAKGFFFVRLRVGTLTRTLNHAR